MENKRRGLDEILLEHAVARSGVCTRRELVAAGIEPSVLTRRVQAGRLRRVGTGIYVVPALVGRYTPHAIALASAPGGALSHQTAAQLHGFRLPGELLHLTVPKGLDNKVPGFTVHETRRWTEEDIVEVLGMRVTSPARTLCDLAGMLRPGQLPYVTEQQLLEGRPTEEELRSCLARLAHPSVPGAVVMSDLFEELFDDEPYPQSELEFRVFAALASRGVWGVHRQFRPPWYDGVRGIVDGADESSRTIIEADGRRWHASSQAQDDDARRDRTAAANGWLVVRVTWSDINDRREATLDELEAVIESRRGFAAA